MEIYTCVLYGMFRFDPNPYLTDKDFVLKRMKLCAKILNEPTRRGSVSSHCSGAQLVEQKSYFRGANSAHNGTSVLFSLPQ